jgi:hypothetical protein
MEGTLLACEIEKISTRVDGSLFIGLGTPELSPSVVAALFGYRKKLMAIYLSPKETINQKEVDQVDKLNPEIGGKTQSQRLRNVLFKLYDQNNEGHKTFDAFYHYHTEVIIEHLKKKIN